MRLAGFLCKRCIVNGRMYQPAFAVYITLNSLGEEAMSVFEERSKQALEAIKQAFGSEAGEGSIGLFVEHHLEELPEDYWQQHIRLLRFKISEEIKL